MSHSRHIFYHGRHMSEYLRVNHATVQCLGYLFINWESILIIITPQLHLIVQLSLLAKRFANCSVINDSRDLHERTTICCYSLLSRRGVNLSLCCMLEHFYKHSHFAAVNMTLCREHPLIGKQVCRETVTYIYVPMYYVICSV